MAAFGSLKPRSHLHLKPSRTSHGRQFSRNGLGRGYLLAVTGSTTNGCLIQGLHGHYGVYVSLFPAKIELRGSYRTALRASVTVVVRSIG